MYLCRGGCSLWIRRSLKLEVVLLFEQQLFQASFRKRAGIQISKQPEAANLPSWLLLMKIVSSILFLQVYFMCISRFVSAVVVFDTSCYTNTILGAVSICLILLNLSWRNRETFASQPWSSSTHSQMKCQSNNTSETGWQHWTWQLCTQLYL